MIVDYKDLEDFFDLVHNYDESDKYMAKFLKYGVNRGDDNFWQVYDWFQKRFNKDK